MSPRPAALAVSLTGRPSTAISSPTVARSPSLAARPPTVTRPASIQDSISRREPRPAAASSFWSRSAFCAGGGFGLGFGVGGTGTRLGGRGGLKLEGPRDFLWWRPLFQASHGAGVPG